MAEMAASGKKPDVLFWVGCSGSFDEEAQKITRALVKILYTCNINFAVLGAEESCTGDPAKRAGNEFLFQMQAMNNINLLNNYGVKKIITACPHCFNTFKNEYPELGGHYEVVHHSQFLQELISRGVLKISGDAFKNKKVTFHDPCYLGRGNNEYDAPRQVLSKLDASVTEMLRSKQRGFCCGAGGAQMFKDSEKGKKDVNIERTEEAIATGSTVIATGCPFCMTMMKDGVKHFNKESEVSVLDIAQMIETAMNL